MKRFAVCLVVCAVAVSVAAPVYCHEGPVKKLGRGVANVVTCECELWNQIDKTNKQAGVGSAMTLGVLKGAFMICARAVVGVYEVATFPFPAPNCYEAIMKDPEFFFPTNK